VLYLSILLFLLGLILFWLARRRQKASGLPGGRVIYTDTRGWGPVEKPLYDPELGLTGKPDYLVEQGKQVIPVEVKSRRVSDGPYDSHIFQLAAYCRLVQVTYGKRPAYGILKYTNRTFAIDYTPELETGLTELLALMREQERSTEVNRSHQSAARCGACGYRATCDQKLS
jgi:CRISPR-associated exonuclease Cas4